MKEKPKLSRKLSKSTNSISSLFSNLNAEKGFEQDRLHLNTELNLRNGIKLNLPSDSSMDYSMSYPGLLGQKDPMSVQTSLVLPITTAGTTSTIPTTSLISAPTATAGGECTECHKPEHEPDYDVMTSSSTTVTAAGTSPPATSTSSDSSQTSALSQTNGTVQAGQGAQSQLSAEQGSDTQQQQSRSYFQLFFPSLAPAPVKKIIGGYV